MQSSKTPGTGGTQKRPSSARTAETSTPRGLANTSNGAGTGSLKKTNGKSRGEADSYYGTSPAHPLVSSNSAINGGAHDASIYCSTDPGNGVSGMYNPEFQSTYSNQGASYGANTIDTGVSVAIPNPSPSASQYNPVPVPQMNPFYPSASAAFAGTNAIVSTNNSHTDHVDLHATGEAASYYADPQTGTSVASSFGSTPATNQQNNSGLSHSIGSSISAVAGALHAHHNHNHSHSHNHNHPPPPLRQSFRKLWESLRAEERYAVGEFELYSEITGVCAKCFTPGTSYTQAPRTHHYGQRWSKSKGWRVRKSKSSRRVWMIIFRRNDASGFTSASSSSSSSDSTSSVSDSDLSDTTRKRRRLEKQIIREKKELKRQEKREQKEQDYSTRRHSNGSSILTSTGSAANTIWKNISGGSAGESDHRYTKTSTAYSAPGVLRGGDLNKSKDNTVFYNPGYGPDGKAHPTYYPQSTPHATNGKTSQSVLNSWFGSSSNTRKSKHSRNGSRASVDSNNAPIGQLFDVSSSASDDGLAYGRYSSSPSSLGSKKKGWFFRMKRDTKGQSKGKKGKGKPSASSDSGSKSSSSVSFSGDELAYGSGKSASLGSASIKSKQSYTGSVAESVKSASSKVSSVFGIGKRRKGWDDYGTPSHGRNGSGSAMVGPGMKKSNSTGGSRGWGSRTTSAPAATVAPVTATGTSSWWSNRMRKSDSSTTTGKKSLGQGGWLPGGDRQSGGWFGGSGTTRTSRPVSLGSLSDNSWQEGLENEEHQEPYVYNLEGGETKSSSAISSTLIGTKSHSSTDVTSSIKDKGIYVQRQSSDSQVFTTLPSGERKSTREVWIQDNRRERSPDRSNFMSGRPKRESSVDSWESYDSRQQDPRQSREKTSKTGIWSLFSGRSQSIRDSDRGHSKESKLKSKRTDERVEGSGKKSAVYVGGDGKLTRKESKSSTTSDIATPKAEQPKLAMVYPMATDDPTRFETTSSETNINRRQSEGYSFVQESYKSEQRYSGQERHSSRTAASATAIATVSATAGEGTKVVVGGFSPLPGSVEQPRRPLAAPIQPVQPVQPTNTTTIINNTIHHITSNTNNNSSTSISNVAQNVVVVPSPVPVPVHSVSSSSVERTHSQSSTAGYSAAMVQGVAAAAASAAAVQVASAYERERAEREEHERREIISRERRNESEKERSERVQRELMELRLREEEAALLHKEKSEREEKERRALRVAIELKEQEESDLKLKRGREEREAIERKKKEEWVARETEKDEAARLARQKQDKERFEQIKADEERKYREWCRQESLRRQQRERGEEERFQQDREEEEENNRRLEAQAVIQKEAERIKAIEVAKRLKIEEELQRSKDEEKKAEQRRVQVSVKLEEEARKIQKPEEGERAYETAPQSPSAGLASQQQKGFADGIEFQKKRDAYIQAASQGQQSSIEVQRMVFQREQDRLAQQAQAVEDLRRVQFEAQIHSTKREQQNIETQRIEISEERSRTTEKLSKLTQVAFEAQRLGDKSKVREVEQQIEVEKEKASRLRIEEEKKAVAVAELKRQEDMRVRELEMQVADERKRDVAALAEGQKIVAAEAEAKKRQYDEKIQQLNSQIRIEKDKETKLKIEEEKRVLDQMEQTRLRDEKTREYIAQVHVEEEKSMQIQVEQQKSAQVEAKSRHRQDESRSIAKQMVTEEERVRLRQMDQERGQIETRRQERTRIEEERGIATAVEQLEQGALEHEAANQAALEFRFKEEEGMSEEQRMIQAEVRRRWENERKEKQRIELEKQLADIQRKIAEKEQRETKRARSRARKADPAYKEREDRRSRERSKVREDEAEKARRAEIEFIRKNAGLDKVEKKKEVKKKRYSTFDPLPTGDIPGFTERSWSVPNGIPRLIETPATPPPGILRFPQRIHCEGSYFPRVPIDVDPNIPVVPAFPQIYVAEPETFAETSTEFEGRSQKDLSMSTSRTKTTQPATSSQFEAVAESSRKIERSITSSEFEGRTEKDSVRVEPVRAVTTSEVERSSETTGAASSVTEGHSIAPAETTKPVSGWGSSGFGSGLAKAVTQAISDAPSLVTGKPFSGTPVAPTPTVPNLGAAVIDYQQRSDSQQDGQTVSQQQQQQELYQYGPPLPPNFSFKEFTRTADGPELPQSFGHQTSSAVYQDSTRSDSQSQSTYEWVSLDHSRQQATKPNFSEVVYGPALPPVSAPQQTAYNQGATVSSDRHSESYSREQISSQVVSTPVLPQVQTPHQNTYDDSTQSFRIPGTFDDEEVPPEVISPISRNNQTSSVPVYYPPTEINNRLVSERNARSESVSRVESLSKEISVDQISLENQASSVPTYRPTVEDRTVSELFYSVEDSSKSGLSISKETGVDVREISHDNQMSSVSINHPALAGENRSMSEPAKGIYSTESTSGLTSLSKEVDLRENSRGDQSSSTPVYPTISGDKRAFSEPASALYLAESETRQTSSLSRDQDFQTPPSGSTHESTPIQGVPSYRQQPSPPNVFAFLDEEASAVTSSSRERVVVDDKCLTQEQIDKNDDLMAVAMASAEEAGFSTDLAYGGLNRHRLSTVLESGETTPTGRRPSIARPRSAFIEEVEDEDSPKAKRQLGQHELSPEAYLSQAETLARDEARSQSEQRLVEQQSRPSTSYSSTPKAEERRPVNVPLPQPTPPSVTSVAKESLPTHSAASSEAVAQERRNRAHGVSRTPAPRSASVSSGFKMDPVREDDPHRPPPAPRSSSLSGFFRSKGDSSRRGSSAVGPAESLHGSAPSFADSGVGLERNDSTMRGRVPRTEEEEVELRKARRQREREEFERRDRGREGPTEPSALTSHEQPSPVERHSRRSIDSVRRFNEGYTPAEGTEINEEDGKAEPGSPHKARSKMQKVTTLGKMFGWNRARGESKSRGEKSGSKSREASQTRSESVKSHKRSVSDASGMGERPAGLTRHNTEEWEQVGVTPPQKSRASSLREVDMGASYERVENDTMGSAPMGLHEEPENYSEGADGSRSNFDSSAPQYVEASTSKSTPPEATAHPETPERPKSERRSSTKAISGMFRAARSLRRGSQTPPRITTEELGRTDTDRKGSRPSSSAGVSLHQDDAREEQGRIENTWGYSSRGDLEEQRAEDIPLPSSGVEEKEPGHSRLPLSREKLKKSTKSLGKESEAGGSQSGSGSWSQATAEGREEEGERGSDSNSTKKSRSFDRKVKQTANSHAQSDGEPVAKSYNCVEKSTSAMMLTLSEGVDLSSDVKGQQEDTRLLFEPPDVFDDRDSPPSNESLPLESPNSLYSPIQHIPDTVSFVSHTPSPVLEPATVDIYEEYPASSQSDSSPNSPHISQRPKPQNTAPEPVLGHDKVIASSHLSGLSSYVQTPVGADVQPQWQPETQSPFVFFQASLPHNFPINPLSMPEFPKAVPEDRSVSPKNVPISPVNEVQSLPLSPNNPSTQETFESFQFLPKTGQSTPEVQQQETPIPSIPDPYQAPTEYYPPSITENRATSPTIEVQPATSTPLSEPRPVHDGIGEDKAPAVDRYIPPPVNENQELTVDTPIEEVGYHSQPNTFTEDLETLPLSPIERQESFAEQQFDKETGHFGGEPQSPDPASDALEGLSNLFELPLQDFREPNQEFTPTSNMQNDPPVIAPSEPSDQSYVQVQSASSLSGRSSPHLSEPVSECSQYVPQDGQSPLYTSPNEKEVAQPAPLQLDTGFSYHDTGNLPGVPLSDSSPTFFSPESLPAVSSAALVAVPDESSISRAPSAPESPVVVLDHDTSTLPLSEQVSPRNQPEIPQTEPAIENFSLISRPSSPQLPKAAQSSPEQIDDMPTTLVDLSGLPETDLVSTYPTFEESIRQVDSRSPSIVAEDEPLTGACLDEPTSPMSVAVPDDLPQLPESSSLYDAPEALYEFTALSPIEEMSESAISRPPSTTAGEGSSVAMPTNHSSSLDTPAATTYEPLELRRGESPVLELSHEGSSEPRQPDVATLTEETPPTMVATVPDTLSESSVVKNEVEPEADMTPSNIEDTAPNDPPEVTQQELPMTDLGVQLGQSSEAPSYTAETEFVPEAYSTSPALPPVISTSIPKSSMEEDIVPGFSLEQPVGYGVQQEIPNSNPTYENIPLQESEIQSDIGISIEAISPSNKDIPPEPASIPLPEVEEAWDYSPVEPVQSPVQLREDTKQPTSEQIPEHKFSETEPKPTSRRSSLDRAQLSPVLEATEGLEKPENMPLSENYLNLVSEEPTIIERSEQNDFSPEELVPEYTFPAKTEQEPISRRTSLDGPQLSPIMEASEEPELESLSLSESVSSPVPEHSMTELPGIDLEMSTGDFPPEDILPGYNPPVEAERESISRRASEDRVQLSPILEDTEEPESLPLPDDIPVSLQSLSTGPSAAEALEAEAEAELPNNDQLAEYTLPEEIEVESIARQFSVEGSQFPQLSMSNQTPVSVVNLVSYEDTVTPLPSDLTESAERYMEEANEIPFFPVPAEVPEISVESPFEPTIEVQQVEEEEEEQATSQPIYDTLPPVEIEPFMPNTEAEFNKDVEISESKIENDTEIEKVEEEEETQKKESQDEEKEHAEIQDIQFNEARETMAPSSYSDAGEEEKFNEDKIPEPYAGGATFEPAALVEAGGGGVGAWEQGVQLEMPTDTEESNIEAEPIPEEAAEESTQEPIPEPTPEQYGASIVESSSPTGEQPGNQFRFHASSGDPTTLPDTQTQVDQEINTEPESQHDALVGDEGEQEGVVSELPVVTKQAPAGEEVVLDKEEGKSENAAQENDEEKAQTQHDSTTEFPTLEQAERFWNQEELSTPTVWPTPIPEVESEVEETAIPESEPQYQNEESQAHNQEEEEEEEERMEPLTSTEEEPVTEKQVDEHKDIQETRSEHQERVQTRPESPKLENEVDWSELPSSDTALPGANTEPLEREEPRSEFQQDIEYHHFREKPLDQLELSPGAPASPTTKQEVVEQEALLPPPEFESLPETGNIEASAIREATEVEVKRDGSREQYPDQSGPSVDLTISPIPHELDDFVESRSPVLSPPQNKFEAVKAMAVEPELGETSNTINEPIESSQDNHIEENVDILPPLSEETSPFVGDSSFTTQESYLPFTTPDFPEIPQSAIDVEQDSKKDNRDISATSPQLEEPGHQSRPPTPQNDLPTVESSRPASPSTEYEDILKRNEETRQIPTLPEIPAYTELELSQKQVSIDEPQMEHAIIQAPVVESDTLEYPAPLSSQFVAHMTPGPEEQNSENNKEVSPATNQDQEEIHQLAPPPKGLEASYQVPKGLTEHVPAPTVTKPSHSRDVPRIPINEEVSTQITEAIPLPQATTIEKSTLAKENKSPEYELVPMQTDLSVPGYESVPMQPTLSEGSKRKSKKARQREKKRRSLQGIDISTASTAETEIMQTPSVAEYPSPSSVVEPMVQNGSDPSPATTKHEDQVAEKNAEVKLDRGDEGDKHIQASESMSKDFTQGYRSLDMGFSEAQKPLSDESTKIENPNRELPVPLRSPSPVIQPEVTGSDLLKEEIKEGTGTPLDRPLPTHQTTPASPSLGTVVADLEDLPGLPPSQPPSRPGTPEIVVDPPSESTPPRFSESRSARKVDVGYLRLPSNIPRDEGLPQLSRDGVVDNEYTGGVSLQLGSETLSEPPSLTTSNDTNISHTFDDPEDEDPSLSSFGDGAIQAVPVAQVGLRSPIFPGGSRPQNFLGTLNPSSQRFFSQQGDIDDPGHDPLSPEGKNQRASTPPIKGDPRAEDGEKGEEGEEGIEHGGDHGSHDTTVITAIENEAAQSDNKKKFPTQVPLKIPVISEEAAPVSKEKTTNTYYTVNAEDPPSQTTINKSTPTTELPLLPPGLSKNLPIEAFESTLSLEQTPLTHTKLTESFPTSSGVPVFLENLSQLHTEPSITTQSQTENQGRLGENTNIPPSEPSITPPPLTHSSSFESAIEFWKRQISIPTTTDLIPSPELSPYATHSESGVPLPVSTSPKSPTRPPLVGQASKPLDRETKDSSTTTAGSSVETATASHLELEAENKGSFSGQDPEPPIPDPSYQVSIRKASGENKPRKNIIEINLQKPGSFTFQEPGRLSRRESLKTQDSCDSLRTVITKDDRAPSPATSETRDRDLTLSKDLPEIPENWVSEDVAPETETSAIPKGETNKAYKSVFGKQSKSASDPFVGNQQAFQLSQKILDSSYPGKPSPEAAKEPDNLGSPIRFTKPNLPNITERKPEEAVKQNPPQTASTNERSFISADDLLARLPLQTARKLTPIPGHSSVPQKVQVPSDKKMDILKRGERRRPAPPSLRRAGSQLESPNTSSEHVIFGGGYQTQDSQGKTLRKTDLYEAWGDKAGEPKSPTRPPSIRRRQSMQIVDLENRLEGLASENTSLTHEKANIEKTLSESIQRHKNDTAIFTQELENGKVLLIEKDSEITELKKKLDYYREEVARLSQANDSLTATNTSLSTSYKFSYGALAGKYERKREQLANLSKEHSELQASFSEVQATMENVIRNQLREKDSELERLRDELAKAREEVRKLQNQVTTRQDNKYLDTKDLHHFSSSCQQLYGSLKIWCNQFSSFSTGKKCVHVHRLKDEAVRDRVEDVMLDDRGVRRMLKDEKRRSEVFMAITMRMIWEHVFTRYLFGLEVDERQKLLSLEKTLAEVGEHEAVHQWRATTLTLLSTRPAIETKRATDTEEIVHTILNLLNFLLPPPPQYNSLALESLRNLVQYAVQLAVEMRTQRAEYVMKRPPRPEYDDNGEVTNSVPFIASSMQNRGVDPASDRELESEGAMVKLVLFPQVIRRGNEYGENYDVEVTVLPMQVLVNRPHLRSESRASNKSVGSAWRDQQQQGGGVSRLTPITDHSPGETPRTTPEKAKITTPGVLPMIPEQTIRLVPEDASARAYPSPSAEKRRRLDDQ